MVIMISSITSSNASNEMSGIKPSIIDWKVMIQNLDESKFTMKNEKDIISIHIQQNLRTHFGHDVP